MPHTTLSPIWSAVTSAQSAPTDASRPTADWDVPSSTGLRGDTFVVEFDLIVTSSTATAVIDQYVWDGTKWSKTDVSYTIISSQTTAGPASRRVFDVATIRPYKGINWVLSSITGSIGASITCRAAAR